VTYFITHECYKLPTMHNPCCNIYCHSADRSPSPSGSPQSSPRPSPQQHHRRDHSKGEIPVGSCKENSSLDKSDIIEVSNSVCLFVSYWEIE
jgi:hypothetical protein